MKAHRQFEAKAKRFQPPTSSSLIQRQCACGGACAKCSDHTHDDDLMMQRARASGLGHDFRRVGVFAGDGDAVVVQDQTATQSGGLDQDLVEDIPTASIMEPTETLETESNLPKGPPVIDSVELVDSSSGAVGGFDDISCGASLNQPGPYNDHWARGSVANVQQIHFHLSQGWPGDVRANRQVNRTATVASKPGQDTKVGWDGPPAHEFVTTRDKLVIADAPGFCSRATEGDFPVTYSADFSLYAFDPLHMNILASISYHVEISKTSFYQIDPVNTITVTDKKIGSGVTSPVPPKT